MQKHHVSLSSYQFRRSPHGGLIQVLNEGSYVMAEYDLQTGAVKWQRVVLATQRAQIETWLSEQYPISANPLPETRRRVSAPSGPSHKKRVLA
jgi:hypothetical protein